MVKTKATPRGSGMKPVTTVAKWPDKTEKFLGDIDGALSNFDNEISSVDHETREAAYETFVKAYKTAVVAIWPNISDANIETLLQSVKDTRLQVFC